MYFGNFACSEPHRFFQVPGTFYVNDKLRDLMFEELHHHASHKGVGGFLPAVKQIANVAALPGIVKVSGRHGCG